MSANNQTLIKKHGDKYLVFPNTNAESWGDLDEETGNWKEGNFLYLDKEEYITADTLEAAYLVAKTEEMLDETEYGIVEEVLIKDGAGVKIVEAKSL